MKEEEIYKGMREEQLIEIILNFKSAFRELQKENAELKARLEQAEAKLKELKGE